MALAGSHPPVQVCFQPRKPHVRARLDSQWQTTADLSHYMSPRLACPHSLQCMSPCAVYFVDTQVSQQPVTDRPDLSSVWAMLTDNAEICYCPPCTRRRLHTVYVFITPTPRRGEGFQYRSAQPPLDLPLSAIDTLHAMPQQPCLRPLVLYVQLDRGAQSSRPVTMLPQLVG